LICILSGFLIGQTIDLGAPKEKIPDRVIPLKLLYALSGDSAIGYFFKNPSAPLFLSGDQSLLLSDQGQLLHFDQGGKFKKNLQKVGEGPGEWAETNGILASGAGVCVVCDSPNKLLVLDGKLSFNKEIRLDKSLDWLRVFKVAPADGSLMSATIDFAKASSGVKALKVELKHFNPQGQVRNSGLVFSHRIFMNVVHPEKGGLMIQMNMVDPFWYATNLQKKRLLINSLESYRLELVDLQSERIIKILKRKMNRQPWRKNEDVKNKSKKPDPDYFMDINALASDGERFWVFTAEIDKQKGVRVDLISSEGEYLDRFWLALPGLDRPDAYGPNQIGLSKDRIAWIHQDEEDNPMVSVFAYDLK